MEALPSPFPHRKLAISSVQIAILELLPVLFAAFDLFVI